MRSKGKGTEMIDDKLIVSLNVVGLPVAQPRHKVRIVNPAKVKGKGKPKPFAMHYIEGDHPIHRWKDDIQSQSIAAMQETPPTTAALKVSILFVMQRPATKRWKTKPMPREVHTSKPDLDNLAKAVLDAMSGIVYLDDRQVAQLTLEKQIASGDEEPHAIIAVMKL